MTRFHLKVVLLSTLAVLTVLFVVQNLEAVEIRFLFWSMSMSRALLVLIFFLLGALVGWLLVALAQNRHDPY
ncbi:MAG: LapA family protein [Xanthomonadaceae bacterium]|nr:LapA family protein [Xanthomonadaceae bacterium]